MPTNHQANLSIWKMLLNRLPYLEDNVVNETKASEMTLEIMYELEVCLDVDADVPAGSPSKVGDENFYSIPQRSLIADILACMVLLTTFAENMQGNAITGATAQKFLSEVVAGSVTAKWEPYKVKDAAAIVTSGERLYNTYYNSAQRKAYKLGCLLDLTGNSVLVELFYDAEPSSFIVINE